MVRPPVGATGHLPGPALALKPPWEQWFIVGLHSPLSLQLTHMAPSKNRPGRAVSPLAWGIRVQTQARPFPKPSETLEIHL